MRRPVSTALLGAALSLLLLAPLSGVPASADPDAVPALPDVVLGEAPPQPEEALDRVQELFAGGVGAPPGAASQQGEAPDAQPSVPVTDDRDTTLALRDLLVARSELSARDRAAADDYLARPTDVTGSPFGVHYRTDEAAPTCGTDVCVHRVDSTTDADAATQRYADRVLATAQAVHGTYAAAGYRAPKKDGAARFDGGDARTDVYLADIGDKGIFGYCTTDDTSGSRSTWAYCVLDNDYAPGQYSANTPQENLQVTVAHEYFHAVQFGYDILEDAWLMEGTATWVEDEMFDDVDDSVSYLRHGPMGAPARSLDLDRGGLEVYGVWSFWRFLTERFPAEQAGLPILVREVWEEVDSVDPAGTYSLRGLRRVLAANGTSVRTQFADYVAANRFPEQRYEEGAANRYPRAPTSDRRALTRQNRSYASSRRLGHLSGATVRLEPGAGLTAARWVLKVRADLPPRKRGSELRVSVVAADGTATTTTVPLRRSGEASFRRPFSSRTVEAVEVHLVNASTRVRNCFSSGAVSCQGFARDDRLPAKVSASVRAR